MKMKKLFILLAFIGLTVSSFAQTNIAQVAGSKTLEPNSYVYFLGATTDTLAASDTITLDLRVRGAVTPNVGIGLYLTKVSGTVTNTFVTYYSMDGVTYTSTGDTLTNTNATTGLKWTVNFDDYVYPYLRIRGISGATAQKAYYKVYAINREE